MPAGTVSKILWHFTGGKKWDARRNRYSDQMKSHIESVEVVKKILESQTLKVGSFKEKIFIDGEMLETNKVCCVADIPSVHLDTHSKRYGKCAIGFHRDSLIRNGFNPVFYIRQDKAALTELQKSFSQIRDLDFDTVDFMNVLLSNPSNHGDLTISDGISSEFTKMKEKIEYLKRSMKYFQSFIKTINDTSEWNDIYLEREWRYPHDFNFSISDIAMVVLPKQDGLFDEFCESELVLKLPRKIPVIAFEDLVEH